MDNNPAKIAKSYLSVFSTPISFDAQEVLMLSQREKEEREREREREKGEGGEGRGGRREFAHPFPEV